tara:strand:+ start:193 stop:393 length:201 start_codon:yes stop_codon:yes gene_type:complete
MLDLLEASFEDRSASFGRILFRELASLRDVAIDLAAKFSLDKTGAVAERGRFAMKMLAELGGENGS